MLFLIALEMVFEKRTERREDRAAKVDRATHVEDVSIFPMAMPMIAGPGSIATVMLLMARTTGLERSAVVLAAMAANLLLTLVALLAAGPLMRVLGRADRGGDHAAAGRAARGAGGAIRDRRGAEPAGAWSVRP